MDEDGATPIALSVLGLDGRGERAQALEAVLRRLHGVVRAYVSPITALAYLDYRTALISEEQIVGAIADAGYGVDALRRRFAWR